MLHDKRAHLDALAAEEAEAFDLAEYVEDLKEVFGDLQATLESEPVSGRQTLRKLLSGPIVSPTPEGFTFKGRASYADYDLLLSPQQPDAPKLDLVVGSPRLPMKNQALAGEIDAGPSIGAPGTIRPNGHAILRPSLVACGVTRVCAPP